MKLLPVGIQTFADIVTGGFVYVDKTKHIYNLIKPSKAVYFLSRPRRFGKSLLISTLDAIFRNKRELFKGLWLDSSDYEWAEYPVIRIDLSKMSFKNSDELEQSLYNAVTAVIQEYGLEVTVREPLGDYFAELIEKLAGRGKVAILIDEYDKPLISNLTNQAELIKIRDILRNFYGIIKASDEYLRFVFLTGVSKFAQVSVFSGLNNLDDISMSNNFADLLGYTQEELESNFKEHIERLVAEKGIDRQETLKQIKHWYNGYRFSHDETKLVYNPYSTLLLFQHRVYKNHWFDSATPTFLIDLLKEQQHLDLRDLDNTETTYEGFSHYEVENLEILPLLVQTGYLTIRNYRMIGTEGIYTLGYPNEEVRRSFIRCLLEKYGSVGKMSSSYIVRLHEALAKEDYEEYFRIMRLFFARIPYDVQLDKEQHYESIFYLIHSLLGYQISVEVPTSRGRADAVIDLNDKIYIFEFKLNGTKEEAIAQIKEKGYADGYKDKNRKITLIGAAFDKEMRNIAGYLVERLQIA